MNKEPYCTCFTEGLKKLSQPAFRLVCHCKTCREYLKQDLNDECNYFAKSNSHLDLTNIEFKSYQKGFSPIKRGTCLTCNKPAFSKVKVGLMPEFLVIPTAMLPEEPNIKPFAHLYYSSAVHQVNDGIKKIKGHILSQIAIQVAILKSII